MEKPNCLKCKFLCVEDDGYSDYTVEGTWIQCLHDGFENRECGDDSEAEREEEGLLERAAATCGKFTAGDPLQLNVEYSCKGEWNYSCGRQSCKATAKENRLTGRDTSEESVEKL